MVARLLGLLIVVAVAPVPTPAAAQPAADPITYTVSFPAPQTHYVEIAARVPTGGRSAVDLMMAVWTPGSYMIREYARHVEAVTAATSDGRALGVEKTAKNRWRVQTAGAAAVTVRYRVYAREMSVRTNWVEADFAMLNGAPTFLTLVDGLSRPHEVVIQPAEEWERSITALPEMPGGPHRYRAPDFDTLVDSPIVVGNPAVYEFAVAGTPHLLANIGEAGIFDGARAARDLGVLVEEQRGFWGFLPYDKYVVINVLTAVPGQIGGGGLEHKDSTLLMASPWATRTRQGYLAWLELASHELFHAWNVKRLRPVELGPFNYEEEVFTRSLWIAEGVTDYFAELLVHRAGLSTQAEYLASLSAKIEEVQTTPGRSVQPVDLASFDAWIKYYRPDENSPNVSVSYYSKGAVVAFLLDAEIRLATGGEKSLGDVLRQAYMEYSGARGYTPEDFQEVAEEVAGTDLDAFWNAAVEGTEELAYERALDAFGLRFRPNSGRSGGAWLGVSTRNDAGRLVVTRVRRDSPAWHAGVNVDDELIAIDGFRVHADELNARLDRYEAGRQVALLVSRRDQLREIELTLGAQPPQDWRIEVDPDAPQTARERRADWLESQRA